MAIQQHDQPAVEEVQPSVPPPEIIGNAFANQYYHILQHSPELVYRFYSENSKLGRPETDGTFSCVTTLQAINEKILSLDCNWKVEVKTIDSHALFDAGVMVHVTGCMVRKDDSVKKDFVQSFFLAPQEVGYFVLNDIFRYTDDSLPQIAVTNPMPEQGFSEPVEQQIHEEACISTLEEETNVEEAYKPSENGEGSVIDEASSKNEVAIEVPNDSEVIIETNRSVVQEETPKKSYASIVKVMEENIAPLPSSAPNIFKHVSVKAEMKALPAQPPSSKPVTSAPSTTATVGNGKVQEAQVEGFSIYVKNLPMNATVDQLAEEFKRFGPIKSGGIQVRSHKQEQFCFGFVEFVVASAVQSAIEASPIMIGGRPAQVEEKRASGPRVNNRGRFVPGRGGGFRNDGARGNSNYTLERDHGREEFTSKANDIRRGNGNCTGERRGYTGKGDFGSRGGGRGERAYQRVENGGRTNRPGGFGTTQVSSAPA